MLLRVIQNRKFVIQNLAISQSAFLGDSKAHTLFCKVLLLTTTTTTTGRLSLLFHLIITYSSSSFFHWRPPNQLTAATAAAICLRHQLNLADNEEFSGKRWK